MTNDQNPARRLFEPLVAIAVLYVISTLIVLQVISNTVDVGLKELRQTISECRQERRL